MPAPSLLSRFPVLRVLVPLAAGILADRGWHVWWAPLALLVLALALYVVFLVRSRSPRQRQRLRPWWLVPLSLVAFSQGWIAAFMHCPPHLSPTQLSGRVLTGRVANLDYTDFSMRMTVELNYQDDLPPCRVLVTTRGCDYTMRAGDLVTWQARLDEVGSLGNPGEVDEATRLLYGQGIRYRQHLHVSQVVRTGHRPTLLTRMDENRRHLRLMVFNSRLAPETQAFVTALLLGDSGFIDSATRQEFAAAGVAHVLALSGLHVGIIALIFWWLLFPLDFLGLKKLRLLLTLVAIILFTLFTGLSPSAVRATVMTGMVMASFILYRRSVALNALALAALIILVFSPSSLYSVGFQLSFVTVAALLVFARLPQYPRRLGGWASSLITMILTSLVAMLATMALTAHYFHTISTLSVLTNLLVLPVMPVIMVLGAIFLLVTAAGMQWSALDWALDVLCRYIHGAAATVGALPMSHLQGIYVSTWGVVASFVIMALVAVWLYRRSYRYLLWAGLVLMLLLAHSLWIDVRTPRRGMVIFNDYSSTPILYYDDGNGYVWTPDDEEPDSAAFARYHAGFLTRYRISRLQFVSPTDTLRLDQALIRPPHAMLMGRRLMAVGSGPWRHMTAEHRLKLDDIIVTKRFHGTAAALQRLYDFDRLILSGGAHDLTPLRHECDSLGITVHDLSVNGALHLTGESHHLSKNK